MDLLQTIKVFITVGEEENLAAAARRLQRSYASVTRAVSALESRLGIQLLARNERKTRLTPIGKEHLQAMKRLLAELAAADQAVSGMNADYQGRISVTAPLLFGKLFVMPCIANYMRDFPRVDVAACFVDRAVNVVDEGHDVAVRIGPQPDSEFRTVPVGAVRRVVVASPRYLADRGMPGHPRELSRHMLISRNCHSPFSDAVSAAHKQLTALRLRARLTVSGQHAAVQAALDGLGIASAMHYQVAPYIADGRLKILLADFEGAPLPVQVLHRHGRYSPRKVRSFIDLLVGHLRQEHSLR